MGAFSACFSTHARLSEGENSPDVPRDIDLSCSPCHRFQRTNSDGSRHLAHPMVDQCSWWNSSLVCDPTFENGGKTSQCKVGIDTTEDKPVTLSCEVKGSGNSSRKSNETRSHHISLPLRSHVTFRGGRRSGSVFSPPRSALAARIRCETSRSLIVASRSSVKRHARPELAPHASGTSTATSSLG